jgi:putative MATE family efflux protein
MIDLTQGSTFRNVILFSMPIIVQGSFQVAYQLINRFWVGHLGKEQLAAVSVSFPVIFLMISIVIGIATGAGIMIAQYFGAGRKDMVNKTARNFLVIGGLAVIAISLLMSVLPGPMLRLLRTPDEAFDDARIYLLWTFATLIFMFAYNAAAGIFRGLGDSRTPTNVIIWTTLLNAVLDPILIYGTTPIPGIPISQTIADATIRLVGPVPPLGVAGAAIATALSSVVGAVVIFILLARLKEYISISPIGFRPDFSVIRGILRLGLPTSATMIMVSLASMVLMALVNEHGTSATAGFGIGIVLDSLVMMPAQSIGIAMSTIAGQNVGAGRKERVYSSLRASQMISGVIGLVVAAVLVLIPSQLTRAFQPEEADYLSVLPYVTLYVYIMAPRYIMIALFFPIIGAIRGAGDAMASMMISMLNQLVISIPAAFLLSHYYGYAGILWALTITTFVGLVTAALYFRSGRWTTKAVVMDRGRGVLGEDDRKNTEIGFDP